MMIQKVVVHHASEASPIMPAHFAFVDENGKDAFDNSAKALSHIESADVEVSGKNGFTRADAEAVVALLNEMKASINQSVEETEQPAEETEQPTE